MEDWELIMCQAITIKPSEFTIADVMTPNDSYIYIVPNDHDPSDANTLIPVCNNITWKIGN